jgi:peptidoglycan/xylan/chitin deacetylase (PgdA/CDA1 family)
MKPYFVKTPSFIPFLFMKRTWHFSRRKKAIYLTFDDGPTPEITDWVLDKLKQYNAKATFFCLGKNIEENENLFNQIVQEGHSIGNHTHNHLNGLITDTETYVANVELAENSIFNFSKKSFKLFRPPYGKMTIKQAIALRKKGFKIIMWDVLSADFDTAITPKHCLNNTIANTENGSIIVFHDSVKAYEKLKFVLPQILDYYTKKGFIFKGIE